MRAAKSLVKAATEAEPETLTAKQAFDIVLIKQKGGWEALKNSMLWKTKNSK